MSQQKVAIVGGGVAAMTAALYLTEQDNWQQQRQITIYQQGWRLGGKGASGRNAKMAQRIEEHGLHVWFGAYVNSFKTIETVYDKLNRSATSALQTWQQALRPHSYIALQEYINNEWQTWPIDFPLLPGNPANGSLDLTAWDFVRMTLAWLKKWVAQLEQAAVQHQKNIELKTKKKRDQFLLTHLFEQLEGIASDTSQAWEAFTDDIKHAHTEITSTPNLLIEKLHQLVHNSQLIVPTSDEKKHTLVVWYIVRKLKRWLNQELLELMDNNSELRRLYICADLAIAMLTGLIKDKVYRDGFATINKYDFRQWLLKNGANKKYSVDSAPVRGFYDLVFAYPKGDFTKPNVEAGVAALAMLRITLCYRGGVMWKMQAGMGDVIFAPLYELLARRGVKFEFFHQLQSVTPTTDEHNQHIIQAVQFQQQVLLNDGHNYQPLVDVKGLPCWPSEPLYAQINAQQAALLQEHNVNLESFWSNWPTLYQQAFNQTLPIKELHVSRDFDQLILGVSVASLVHVCPQLLALDQDFSRQAENVQTVATQACQLWLTKNDQQLGWQSIPPSTKRPILSGFSEPFDTWASMGNLLDKEQWQESNSPTNIAYFCSAYPCDEYPEQSVCDFPAQAKALVKENVHAMLEQSMRPLWPQAYSNSQFDWRVLYAQYAAGTERLEQQYWRVNVDPSERYVLSVAGSSQYRLATNGTLFSNLLITGDWIKTGVNAGCVEAAVMAGMQTSRAVCGYPQHISGEHAFNQ